MLSIAKSFMKLWTGIRPPEPPKKKLHPLRSPTDRMEVLFHKLIKFEQNFLCEPKSLKKRRQLDDEWQISQDVVSPQRLEWEKEPLDVFNHVVYLVDTFEQANEAVDFIQKRYHIKESEAAEIVADIYSINIEMKKALDELKAE